MERKPLILFGGSLVIALLVGILIGRGTAEPEIRPEVVTSYVTKEVSVPCEESSPLKAPVAKALEAETLLETQAPSPSVAQKSSEPDESLTHKDGSTLLASAMDSSYRYMIELSTSGKVSPKNLHQPIHISGKLDQVGRETEFTLMLRHDILSGDFPVTMRVINLKEDQRMENEVYCVQSMQEGYYYDIRVQFDGFVNCMVEKERKRPGFGGEKDRQKVMEMIREKQIPKAGR